jgi:putative tricarboxylic transport membrane protein
MFPFLDLPWAQGFASAFSPEHLLILILASFLGVICGALPGIGASLTMSLLIPFSFHWDKTTGLILLVSAWASAVYGGSITAILINTPGTGGNVASAFDGFPLSEKGRAGEALGISAFASAVGGLVGVGFLIFFSPILAKFTVEFGPAEYFIIGLLALCMIAALSGTSLMRGLISGGIGLLISFMGYDIITGELRFNFGFEYLEERIHFVIIVIGVFGVAQCLRFSETVGSISRSGRVRGGYLSGVKTTLKYPFTLLRSIGIGIIFGFIPGLGTSSASLFSWTEAKRTAKDPESFGKGNPEGLVASEAANNAVEGGALTPTLTLGIPGNPNSAVFLAAMLMYGILPGQQLYEANSDLVATLFITLILSQSVFFFTGWAVSIGAARVTTLSLTFLAPLILLICLTGAYVSNGQFGDVAVAVILGLLGYYMHRYKYSAVCLLLGVIIGPLTERNYHRSMIIYQDPWSIITASYISIGLTVLLIFILAWGLWRTLLPHKAGASR